MLRRSMRFPKALATRNNVPQRRFTVTGFLKTYLVDLRSTGRAKTKKCATDCDNEQVATWRFLFCAKRNFVDWLQPKHFWTFIFIEVSTLEIRHFVFTSQLLSTGIRTYLQPISDDVSIYEMMRGPHQTSGTAHGNEIRNFGEDIWHMRIPFVPDDYPVQTRSSTSPTEKLLRCGAQIHWRESSRRCTRLIRKLTRPPRMRKYSELRN